MSTTGTISSSDPLWNGQVGDPPHTFNQSFLNLVTTKSTMQPAYGFNWFWNGKAAMGSTGILSDNYIWGHTHDTSLFPDNQEAIDLLNNQPRNISQVKWWEVRAKQWNYLGQEIEHNYLPKWTVDGGIMFPDSQRYPANFLGQITYSLSPYPQSRMETSLPIFRFFDHPGIQESSFRLRPPGYGSIDSTEVVVMYANFIVQFLRDNPQGSVANEIHFHIKLLVRTETVSGSVPSGYFGNSEFGLGHINIPDWQSAPTGTQFPS